MSLLHIVTSNLIVAVSEHSAGVCITAAAAAAEQRQIRQRE